MRVKLVLLVSAVATLFLVLWSNPYRHELTRKDGRFFYFGTVIDIQVYTTQPVDSTFQRIESALKNWHHRFHAWHPSELTDLNARLQRHETVQPAPDLADLIKQSQQLAAATEQLFNPALGKQFAAWGFARDNMNDPHPAAPDIDVDQRPDMTDLIWNGDALYSRHRDLQLDLGGVAKGYALQELLSLLRADGIEHAMINLGGDVAVLGRSAQRPWQIAVQDPSGGQRPLAIIALQDGEMAFTSGDYQRHHPVSNATNDRQIAHHVIDPRTGKPSTGNRAVTLVGRDGPRLQAAAKVLMMTGSEWSLWASRLDLDEALVVSAHPDNKLAPVEISEKLAARLRSTNTHSLSPFRVITIAP